MSEQEWPITVQENKSGSTQKIENIVESKTNRQKLSRGLMVDQKIMFPLSRNVVCSKASSQCSRWKVLCT